MDGWNGLVALAIIFGAVSILARLFPSPAPGKAQSTGRAGTAIDPAEAAAQRAAALATKRKAIDAVLADYAAGLISEEGRDDLLARLYAPPASGGQRNGSSGTQPR